MTVSAEPWAAVDPVAKDSGFWLQQEKVFSERPRLELWWEEQKEIIHLLGPAEMAGRSLGLSDQVPTGLGA